MATLLTNISSESKVPHPDEFNPYFAYVGAGVFFFTVVNYLTRFTMPATSAVSFQGPAQCPCILFLSGNLDSVNPGLR